MDPIYRIIAVALVTCLATIILKPVRSDFAIMVSVVGGIIILFMLVRYVSGIFDVFMQIFSATNLSSSLYKLVFKIIAVGYLIEFSASICSDTGNASLGDKVLLGGKIIILVMALPIITNILNIVTELLPK